MKAYTDEITSLCCVCVCVCVHACVCVGGGRQETHLAFRRLSVRKIKTMSEL